MVRVAPAPAACAAEAPAAAVDMLTREKGYDTTNNLNKLLTQGFSCSIPDRNKKALFSTLTSKINALEVHDLMSKYQAVKVGEVSVVGALRLVRRELESKEPHVSPTPTTRAPRALEVEVWVLGSDAWPLPCAGQTARLHRGLPEAAERRAPLAARQGDRARHGEAGGPHDRAQGVRAVD